MRVVVIGAGFAGLIAADRIARSGQRPVVLEARDRVGGRVWSQQLLPGDERTVVERGAEFVLDGYDVMRSKLAEFGLELAGTAMSYYAREPRGGAPTTPADVAACAKPVRAAASAAGTATSLADLLRQPTLRSLAGPALDAYVSRVTTPTEYPPTSCRPPLSPI